MSQEHAIQNPALAIHIPQVSFNRTCVGLAKKMIYQAFSQMTRGQLTMTLADGTRWVFGTTPEAGTAEMNIHDDQFFIRGLLFTNIGMAESYILGEWDTTSIAEVIGWFLLNANQSTVQEGSAQKQWLFNILSPLNRWYHLRRPNSYLKSKTNIQAHYDLSNDFFKLMLDRTMTYSSAYFKTGATDLEAAQLAKYENLCQKLRLKDTDHVLEIGSGWGGFAIYAASRYGCRIHTITISRKQYEFAKARIAENQLDHRITIELKDYRELTGQYDKIVSIEMVEAVGDQYLDTFFQQCTDRLKPDGLLAMQMITCPDASYNLFKQNVDFIQKHIFPGSLLPSLARVNQALMKAGDVFMVELEDLTNDYCLTLKTWRNEFFEHLPQVETMGFDTAFVRRWDYYLEYCYAAFKMRNISVVQALYSHPHNATFREGWRHG